MTKWNGITTESPYRYPVKNSSHPLFIDSDGSIYYKDYNDNLKIWCPVSRLRYHMQQLVNLKVIKEGVR